MEIFKIKEYTNHPCFFYPETLISFPTNRHDGVLIDELQKEYPYQIEDGKIYFLTGLNSGETKTFQFSEGKRKIYGGMNYYTTDDFLGIDNGNLNIRVIRNQDEFSGKLFEIDGVSKGIAYLNGGKIKETSVETMTSGELFCKMRIRCKGNKCSYILTITIIYGYSFVILDEEMQGMADSKLEIIWKNLKPCNWYASTWPDTKWDLKSENYGDYEYRKTEERFVIPYNGEDPAFSDIPNDPDAIQIRLGLYAPFFAYSVRPCASFWNRNGESAGVFVFDHEKWDEGDYPVWTIGEKLDGRFYMKDGIFKMSFALAGKSRSLGISSYMRSMDKWWFKRLEEMKERLVALGIDSDAAEKLTCFPTTYTAFLHNRYSLINLDKVKNWELTYDYDTVPYPCRKETYRYHTVQELKKHLYSTGRAALATKGTEEFYNRPYTFEAVELREILHGVAEGYLRLACDMNEEDRQSITALILMTIYLCAGEDVIPVKNMLGGHPNFLADVRSVAGIGAAMFPKHRDAKIFADSFSGYVEKNAEYHTRPAIEKIRAVGGRWTEAIGIYTWAFLTPTLIVNTLLQKYYDGRNRIGANKNIQDVAGWILGILTPPVEGRRLLPPQGAHSALRPPFRVFQLLGDAVMPYNPELAQNIYAVTSDEDRHIENTENEFDSWSFLYKNNIDRSYLPRLKSIKYSGYGMVMRVDENTDDESAVYLMQIDQGPNYRWGLPGEGNCGGIYYFAKNKAWTFNGKEDAGDRKAEDTAYCSNFGVWKDGMYKGIGMNTLTEPLYALGPIQMGTVKARAENPYSYPEFISRSVFMTGRYIAVYARVHDENIQTRFSWFVDKNSDFPYIHFVKGYRPDRYAVKNYAYSEHITAQTKGRWYEGIGDNLCIISPAKVDIKNFEWGAVIDENEYLFIDKKKFKLEVDNILFEGSVGWARKQKNIELCVIGNGMIQAENVELMVSDCGVYMSDEKNIFGKVSCQGKGFFEVSGIRTEITAGEYEFELSEGKINLVEISEDITQRKRYFKYQTPYNANFFN